MIVLKSIIEPELNGTREGLTFLLKPFCRIQWVVPQPLLAIQ